MVQRGDMMNKDDILEILAVPLIGMVPDHEDVIISANRGTPAVYDESSVVGQAYRRITDRVVGHEVPFPDFSQKNGVWATMKRWMGLAPVREAV